VGGNSIAVTSVGPGASRTSTVLQIANAAWREHRTILLIDADVRLRHLSERVAAAQVDTAGNGHQAARPDGGLAKDYIDRLVSTDSGMVLPIPPTPTGGPGTGPDPTGPGTGSGSGSFAAVDVGDTVRSIGELFDLVVIDTPALLSSADSLGIAGLADGVIVVVAHRVALSRLRDVRDRLAFVKTPLLGYIYVRPPTNHTLWQHVTRKRHGTPARRR
jgi:cellulose biosynthesis protein BcsQ